MPFKKGGIGNPKGSPKGGMHGAGRPLEWFRQACREALSRSKSLDRMEQLASFENFPQALSTGEVLSLPPPIREFRAAVEWLTDRGYGKAEQPIVGGDRDSRPISFALDTDLEKIIAEGAAANDSAGEDGEDMETQE